MKYKVGDDVEIVEAEPTDGYSVGDRGKIYKTHNGGTGLVYDLKWEGKKQFMMGAYTFQLKLVSKGKKIKPQKPTHIIVWDTDCGDPHKYCYGLADMREQVKVLFDTRGVKRESIDIIEINNVTKPVMNIKYKSAMKELTR